MCSIQNSWSSREIKWRVVEQWCQSSRSKPASSESVYDQQVIVSQYMTSLVQQQSRESREKSSRVERVIEQREQREERCSREKRVQQQQREAQFKKCDQFKIGVEESSFSRQFQQTVDIQDNRHLEQLSVVSVDSCNRQVEKCHKLLSTIFMRNGKHLS